MSTLDFLCHGSSRGMALERAGMITVMLNPFCSCCRTRNRYIMHLQYMLSCHKAYLAEVCNL